MPSGAPTFLLVPPYTSQHLWVATQTSRAPPPSPSTSGPLEPSAPSPDVHRFGDSVIRVFGDSEVQWFSGSQPPLNNLQRNRGSLDLGPLSVIPAPASADKHAGRTAIKTFANDIKLHVYYSTRVSMSSIWLIRELFSWGHWTW
ncbi:hypothetical protein GGX14DRAFT_392733 [Mycena pura]|uniref:Uncharacterized protein n=1 Tax=Mycena pura TaxID=153505 RepID=A0AAD6VK85_9AGAR|nr:hypothetical protein GGX14DRAFT_392733 [Mycena pura]